MVSLQDIHFRGLHDEKSSLIETQLLGLVRVQIMLVGANKDTVSWEMECTIEVRFRNNSTLLNHLFMSGVIVAGTLK
jgi:hypothetical protein